MKFFLGNPVNTRFRITNTFNSPRGYYNGRHEGIDLRALEDGKAVDILAAQRGVVDHVRWGVDSGYGNYVRIRHEWDDNTTWMTWYCHMSQLDPSISVGTRVRIGQRLGLAGESGNATGVHLHLTLQHLGYGLRGYAISDVVDPRPYFVVGRLPLYDEAMYLADITVPDGTILEAGRPFTKTWQIRNTGTSTWGAEHVLAYFSDEKLDGPEMVPLPALAPGDVGNVSVELLAPESPGPHRTVWKGRGPTGEFFHPELFVEFTVSPIRRRNGAVFVDDVTIPDGSAVAAGKEFLKTWRVRNTGDTTWGTGYSLAFVSHDRLDAPELVPVPTTPPGATCDLSVALRAPDTPGNYRSTWRLRGPSGDFFGDFYFAQITVERAAALEKTADAAVSLGSPAELHLRVAAGQTFVQRWTLRNSGQTRWGEGTTLAFAGGNQMGAPRAVPLEPVRPGQQAEVEVRFVAPTRPGRYRSSWQPANAAGMPFGPVLAADVEVVRLGTRDGADYIADQTVPDGTIVEPGQMLEKTWLVRNSGTTAWGPGYALVFVDHEQMDGPDSVALPPALPGEEVEVTVTLIAPEEPGLQRSSWRSRNDLGNLFGDILFAEVRVASPTDEVPAVNAARLDSHVTIPNGTKLAPSEAFRKTWAVGNTGTTTWEPGYVLAFVGGDQMDGPDAVPVPTAAPQQVVNISVDLVAPQAPDKTIGRWRLRDPQSRFFGPTLFVSIVVRPEVETVDLLDYLRGDGRLYEMKHIFQTSTGPQTGQQRVQTQSEGRRFYIVKNQEWEELWYDDDHIYRGTDTSPGNDNFYTLMEENRYGSPWVPRHMGNGQYYRRGPTVVSRRKRDCNINFHLSGHQVTWIRLEEIHAKFRLPGIEGEPNAGIALKDVVELAAYVDLNGRPANSPFERYYYAKGLGFVMWEGIDVEHRGRSFLVELHRPGARPNNMRENLPCLEYLLRTRPS